jgi:hypothetical protein
MNPLKLLIVISLWIGFCTSSPRPVLALQAPSLIAEAGRSVPTSRGATAQSHQISSAILKETRRIHIVLPGSFSHSAAGQKYPVTIVLDGEDNVPPAFLEYVPGKYAWRPVDAEGWLFVHCLWAYLPQRPESGRTGTAAFFSGVSSVPFAASFHCHCLVGREQA